MTHTLRVFKIVASPLVFAAIAVTCGAYHFLDRDGYASPIQSAAGTSHLAGFSTTINTNISPIEVRQSVRNDVSRPLASSRNSNSESPLTVSNSNFGIPSQALAAKLDENDPEQRPQPQQSDAVATPKSQPVPAAGVAVEQKSQGTRAPAALVESFDGLGVGFEGPQGKANVRNPSDNSLAVGPNHIVQIVNTRMAIYAKKGQRFNTTGKVLYGPVVTNAVFAGFGGRCETWNNGDAVVRYDQLAGRWLIVMPIFGRAPVRPDQTEPGKDGQPAQTSPPGRPAQPGPPFQLVPPPQPNPTNPNRAAPATSGQGPYSMCYAISVNSDPLGQYYRYEFLRPFFPDYPRPAIWPDGYYVPTSTSDDLIQKHACVVNRSKMLKGQPATEQCFVIDGVNFLNNADIDGMGLPPRGAPNIMMAAGGAQLKNILADDSIFAWKFHVDWQTPANTRITGPMKISVAPYQYLCGGQLTNCVPQPGTDRRLDAQGDKIMARLVYRKVNGHESIVAVHSVNTAGGGGGVRWYEFRLDQNRDPLLYQQGTYAPDNFYRWMASPAIDRKGNIGIGYSFGGPANFAGQRFAARLANDRLGQLTLQETVLVEGEGSENVMRWEDYTQTAMDPSDDCTIWYVGDYIKKDATNYSSRIGAFRLPGCGTR